MPRLLLITHGSLTAVTFYNANTFTLLTHGQSEAAVVGAFPAVPGGVRRPHTGSV